MSATPVPQNAPEEEIGFMNLDETDFSSLSRAQQIRRLEVEGYLVMPSILPADVVARVKSEMAAAEMSHTSYSESQNAGRHAAAMDEPRPSQS